ncbi:MAG: hypothetical protein ACP5F3_02330 [Candidatus Syntrophosphaera sp.]
MAALLIALYAALIGLNILDGYSTWKVVRPHHYARERNPLARWIFRGLGIPLGIIVAELFWIGLISLVFFLFWDKPGLQLPLLIVLGLGVIAFAGISLNNFSVHRTIRRREQLARKTGEEAHAGKHS